MTGKGDKGQVKWKEERCHLHQDWGNSNIRCPYNCKSF